MEEDFEYIHQLLLNHHGRHTRAIENLSCGKPLYMGKIKKHT